MDLTMTLASGERHDVTLSVTSRLGPDRLNGTIEGDPEALFEAHEQGKAVQLESSTCPPIKGHINFSGAQFFFEGTD